MKKLIGSALFLMVVASFTVGAFAAEKEKKKEPEAAAAKAPTTEEQQKQLLVNNVQAMQNQEARVVVLQQLLEREVGTLRQMQALFCDQYKLDSDKWRKGLYRFSPESGKFEEIKEKGKE